jgi:hypothetical protein
MYYHALASFHFHENWYEYHSSRGYSTYVAFNVLSSLIPTLDALITFLFFLGHLSGLCLSLVLDIRVITGFGAQDS